MKPLYNTHKPTKLVQQIRNCSTEFSPIQFGIDPRREGDKAHNIGVPNKCRKVSCSRCGPETRWNFVNALIGAVQAPIFFMTLTYWYGGAGTIRSRKQGVKDYTKWIRGMRKLYGPMEYCRIFERTEKGQLHHHMMIWGNDKISYMHNGKYKQGVNKDSGRPYHFLVHSHPIAKLWRKCSGKRNIRIQMDPVRTEKGQVNAAIELSKYLSKVKSKKGTETFKSRWFAFSKDTRTDCEIYLQGSVKACTDNDRKNYSVDSGTGEIDREHKVDCSCFNPVVTWRPGRYRSGIRNSGGRFPYRSNAWIQELGTKEWKSMSFPDGGHAFIPERTFELVAKNGGKKSWHSLVQ